jgi:hypothetical protein
MRERDTSVYARKFAFPSDFPHFPLSFSKKIPDRGFGIWLSFVIWKFGIWNPVFTNGSPT